MQRPVALLLAASVLLSCCRSSSSSSYDRAEDADALHDFVAARRHFAAAVKEERGERKEKAELRLATLEWRVFREPGTARTLLTRVASSGKEPAAAWLERTRLEIQERDFSAARTAARNAFAAAKTNRDRRRATIAHASVVAAEAGRTFVERHQWPSNVDELRRTIAELQTIIADQGPLLTRARLLFVTALFADDGAAALQGWDGYYHVTAASAAPQLVAPYRAAVAEVLSRWRGASSSADDRERLVLALAGSRFFAEAAAIALDPRVSDWNLATRPAVRDVIAYANTIRRVRETSDEYYRNIAAGKEDAGSYRSALQNEARTLWNELSWPGEKPEFTFDAFVDEMAKRFGALINSGKTGGHYDLHMGHRVVDEAFKVEQYGHEARVRFVALDTMVSNGYGSWAGDGRSADGGWADAEKIVQVRSEYADGAIRDWTNVADPEVIAESDRETRDETERDLTRARDQEVATFRGMPRRLRNQYLLRVHEELRAKGLAGNTLRDAFIARTEREKFEYSILLHEGRHAIDAAEKFKGSTADREYRAKLSELALGAAARDALGVILSGPVGGKSPHGEANERLAQGLLAWMKAHRSEIHGLDAGKRLLPQADLLTDEQIRAAAGSLDPFAESKR